MSNQFPSNNIIQKAKRIISEQSLAPRSPAEIDRIGKVNFCAAAALVKAELDTSFPKARRDEFVYKIITNGASEYLNTVFCEIGWSSSLCKEVRGKNDSFAPETRRQQVITMFNGMLS